MIWRVLIDPRHPAHLVAGLVIWCLWFVLMYGGLSFACQRIEPTSGQSPLLWLNGSLLVLTLTVTLLLSWLSWRCWQASLQTGNEPKVRLVTRLGAAVHLFSAAAALAVGIPATGLPPCV